MVFDKKYQQFYKRDSVPRRDSVIYLNRPSPNGFSDLPLPVPYGPGKRPGDFHHRDIHGLSTHEVYPHYRSPGSAVVSYTTFSPLSRKTVCNFCKAKKTACRSGRLFSVALSVSRICRTLPVRKHGALCCPDFPPRVLRGDRTNYWYAKIANTTEISLPLHTFHMPE